MTPLGKGDYLNRLLLVVLAAVTVFTILTIAVLAAVPPVSRDALTHHLYVPKLFLKAGGIIELPHVPFSYYPMNLDLLYMISLYFGNDILPKYIHFLFALITVWLIFRYLDQRIGRVYGLFSAFFFLSIPVVIKLSSTVYVDLGLICFTTGSILMLAEWRDMGFPLVKLVWAGFFCGLALGTKYNGLVTFALLALIVPVLYLRAHPRTATYQVKAVYHGAVFAAVALLVFSPWMIRNIFLTGNPIYPLYQNIFQKSGQVHPDKHQVPLVDEEEMRAGTEKIKWTPFNIRSIIYGESKWEIATIPIRVFFQGRDDNPKYFDGALSPWLILFPLGVLISHRNKKRLLPSVNAFLLTFAVCYLLIVFFKQDMRVRWISPIIPPLVLLSAAGLYRVSEWIGEVQPRLHSSKNILVLGLATFCILSTSIPYLKNYYKKVAPMAYIGGKINREDYIARYRPEYPVIQYANQHLDPSEPALCVFFGNRGYYFNNQVRFSSRFIEAYVIPFKNEASIKEKIRNEGYKYLFINHGLLNRRIKESLSGDKQDMLNRFFSQQLKLIFQENNHGLYMLL